jgi:ketosteroid isomerase-like protein
MGAGMSDLAGMADELAISRVIYRCSMASDRCDQAAMASAYHSDGIEEHGSHFAGLGADFAAWIVSQSEVFTAGVHHVTTIHVMRSGDVAVAESTTFGLVRLNTGQVSWSSGRYLDRLERRNGLWKIAHRRFVRDLPLPVPARQRRTDGDAASAISHSSRSPSDPSYALFAAARAGMAWPPEEPGIS